MTRGFKINQSYIERTDVKSPSEHKPIAQLAHGLSRVLFKYVKFDLVDYFLNTFMLVPACIGCRTQDRECIISRRG